MFEGAACQKLTQKKGRLRDEIRGHVKRRTATFQGRGVDKNNIATS
jgi:hypothetical protein